MPCNICNGQFIDLHSLVSEVVFVIRFSQVYSGKLIIVSFYERSHTFPRHLSPSLLKMPF